MQNLKAYIMLVCATLFWAGNFTIGKFAYLENISPFSLTFLRWLLVWIILMPFTYKEIYSLKSKIYTPPGGGWGYSIHHHVLLGKVPGIANLADL